MAEEKNKWRWSADRQQPSDNAKDSPSPTLEAVARKLRHALPIRDRAVNGWIKHVFVNCFDGRDALDALTDYISSKKQAGGRRTDTAAVEAAGLLQAQLF